MRLAARPVSLAWLLSGAALAAPAEQLRSPSSTEFAAGTERVQVDFVARDKDGVLLRRLSADDVEVYEDGVRQDVESFEFVDLGVADEPPVRPTAVPPAFVALAFDRLSPAGRSFAQQAVLDYLERGLPARSWVGVFSIDRGLRTLQPFTADRETLRRSMGGLPSLASTSFAGLRERDAVRNAYAGLASGIGQAHVAPAELAGVPECRGTEDEVVRRLEILQSRLTEAFESLERDEQGFATTHALLALVGGLQALPGRKAVLLFSEGLAIPAGVEAALRSVVAAANRGNVSIYAADAGGLRVASPGDETRRAIESIRTRLQPEGMGAPAARGPTSSDQAASGLRLLERNEDTLRLAAHSGLGRLADETGGFLIRDTNDLSAGLAEIDAEVGSYHLLSYSPKNQDYDGRFRTITVRLKRPHGRLQARKGYLALKTALPVPALAHEARALALLEARRLPADVPLRLRALQFPEQPPFSVVPIVVEVPAAGLQDFTVAVLVRDASRQVVAKMSQRYALSGAAAPPGAAPRGPVLFYREARLAPGSYTLEAVAYDERSGAAGAAASTLEVPSSASGHLRASSLMVIGNAEKLEAAEGGPAGPLRYGDVLLYPHLGQPLRRAAGQALAFFVTAWPAVERPGVEARVEVVRGGTTVAATAPARLRPDADGRIRLASSLPLERLAPGAYELRVTLSDGTDAETRTAHVPIAP